MKHLFLWRHAKATAGDPRGEDADRELAERGHLAAEAVAADRADALSAIQLVLCSPATRTRQTLAHLQPHLDPAPTLRFERGLYLAAHLELLERIARTEEEHEAILLIGHNPGLDDLLRLLVKEGDPQALERCAGGFKAGSLAELCLDISHWRDAGAGCATLHHFTRPRDLEALAGQN